MASDDKKTSFTASTNANLIFQQNPNLAFSADDLRAIQQGTLVPIPGGIVIGPTPVDVINGCITLLRYGSGDDDLVYVQFDSGDFLTPAKASNLNDFRETYQTAANHGFGTSACLNTSTKKLFMVNLRPCRCRCKRRKSQRG